MNTGHEEPGDGEQPDCRGADERHVEIARPGAVRIERGAVPPPAAGDCAAAQHYPGTGWNLAPQHVDEFPEPFLAAAKGESDDVVAFFGLGDAALTWFGRVHTPPNVQDAHRVLAFRTEAW